MAVAEPFTLVPPRRGLVRRREVRAVGRRAGLGDRIAIGVFLLLVVMAFCAPAIAPHDPIVPAGAPFTPPFHGGFLLGSDEVGQDILSRILYGMRASFIACAVVISSGVLIGGLIGLTAGAAGGWVDNVLMRFTDLFLAVPGPILAIAVVASLGPSFFHTLLAVSIIWWPFYARIVRAEVRALAARPHLEAARLAGVGRVRLALRHLLPGAVPAALVTASLDVSNLIIVLALLSFLGLGAPAPAPELGAMAARGLQYLNQDWWVPVMPSLAIFVIALSANLAGDGVRDLIGDR
ncbi:MAG TPA: ABC transporter permease [Acidimicrobiales bacterium]|nr:ABC transporter permease [Acidimicrobiales bacterium]